MKAHWESKQFKKNTYKYTYLPQEDVLVHTPHRAVLLHLAYRGTGQLHDHN